MTDNLLSLREKLQPVESRIKDYSEQQRAEAEAAYVREIDDRIKERKVSEELELAALQKDPRWQKLFDDPDWKLLILERDKLRTEKAKACREWKGRAWHFLTLDEQKRVAEVRSPFDREIERIENLMAKMQEVRGLAKYVDLSRHGKDVSSLFDLLEKVRIYQTVVEMLGFLGQSSNASVLDTVNAYRQIAERLRLRQPGMSELLSRQDDPSEELRNLEAWAKAEADSTSKLNPPEIKRDSQQKHKGKPIGEVGSSNSIVGAGVESREINVTKPPFSDSKELNAVFADIEQCLQTLEVLSSNYNLLSSLERAGKVRDMVGSIDGMQFTSEDDRLAHDDAERQISAAANILYKPLTRVFAWGRDHRLDLPSDGSELTSQIPYSWWDEDENRGHYEYYAFICEQYQSELDRISKALAVVASKDSVAHIVLESYSSDSPTAIAEVTMLTLDERQIVLQALKKAMPAYTRTFRILYEAHLLPADLILFQQRRDSLHGQFEGWKFIGDASEDDDTFNVMWNAEDFIKRVVARRPTNSPLANPDTPPSEPCDSSVADRGEGDTVATMDINKLEDGVIGLSPLLSDIPALNTTDGSWVRCKLAARLDGIETRTLAKYRGQGASTPDKMGGRDPQRRLWRKTGTPNAHPWYLKSSLKSQAKP